MIEIKFSQQHIVTGSTVFGIILALIAMTGFCLPGQAGPQSLLDPYADVLPPATKSEAKTAAKKFAKQPSNNSQRSSLAGSENSDSPSDLISKPVKDKPNKHAVSNKVSQVNNTANNSGFLSGIKEIQHGYVTSIKAAGSGIVNGSKAAGSKVAVGTKGLWSSAANASHKIVSTPKAIAKKVPSPEIKEQKQPEVQEASALPARSSMPTLPGKPLDQVSEKLPRSRMKDTPVTEKKPGVIAHTFSKLHFFKKKSPPAKVAATNPSPNTVAR